MNPNLEPALPRPAPPSPLRRWTLAAAAVAVAYAAAVVPAPGQEPGAGDLADRIRERIRVRLESDGPGSAEAGGPLALDGGRLHADRELQSFYEARTYRPAWIGEEGSARPAAGELLEALRGADRHGLRPEDYHAAEIDSALAALSGPTGDRGSEADRLARVDLLLTDAFLVYGSHLLSGRVDPRTIDPLWTASARAEDMPSVLERALDGAGVRRALESLAPQQRGYRMLREALEEHRKLAAKGGWPAVPPGPTLREGDAGERVAALWSRLAASGDLPAEAAESTAEADRFDDRLSAAVRRFQRRHGLEADGVVGDSTLAALNVPVASRVDQIELNLERWRWMPADPGERHVRVNIADFEMEVREGDSTVLSMRAIVGRHYRQTPVFSDTIRYVVLNPSWTVPASIAVNDILPQVKQSTDYLARQGMQVFRGWGPDAAAVDPATVDWASLGRGNFPYRFVQRPGPLNALGRVKFMFPNRFSVYLHDTPARGLFAQNVRSFSSGCIRLERPLDFLDYLFRDAGAWTPETLRSALDTRREQTVRLPRPIPVHLQYLTAWVEEGGTVHFRRDIYGRDARLERALAAPGR